MGHSRCHPILFGFGLLVLALGLVWVYTAPRLEAQEEIAPITAATIGQVRPVLSVPGAYGGFSPARSNIIITQLNGISHLWRLADGTAIPLSSPGNNSATFSPDGTMLALDRVSSTTLWDIAEDREILSIEGGFYAFSPDSAYLVTSHVDAWYLWDIATGERIGLFIKGNPQSTPSPWLMFSEDGRWLIWNGLNERLHIWDMHSNEEVNTLSTDAANALFTPDSKLLIMRHRNVLYIWDTATWQVRYSFMLSDDSHLALSADGSRLLAKNCATVRYCDINVFHVEDTQVEQQNTVHTELENIENLVLSPDGNTLFVNQKSEISIWNLNTYQTLPVTASMNYIEQGFYSPDSALLFIRSGAYTNNILSVIDTTTGGEIAVFRGNTFDLSPDGTTLIGTVGEFTLLYGVPDAARPVGRVMIPARILPSAVYLRAAPDPNADIIGRASGKVLASAHQGEYVYLADLDGWINSGTDYLALDDYLPLDFLPEYDPAVAVAFVPEATPIRYPTYTPTPIPTATSSIPTPTFVPPTPSSPVQPVTDAITTGGIGLLDIIPGYLTSAGNTVITATYQGYGQPEVVDVWDLATLERKAEIKRMENRQYASLNDTALSPDGKLLALTDAENPLTIHVWDTQTGQEIAVLGGHQSAVGWFVFSPDGQWLASVEARTYKYSNPDKAVKIWKIPSGTLAARVSLDNAWPIKDMVFSPDGTLLGIAAQNHPAIIWDIAANTKLYELPTNANTLAFSPNGAIAVTFYAGIGRLWDLKTGDLISQINGGGPDDLLFNADSSRLLVVYNDKMDRLLWDIPNGTALGTYDAPYPILTPDGHGWLAIGHDHVLRLWDFETGEVQAALGPFCGERLAISPDGRLVAIGEKIIDLETWTVDYTLPYRTYPVPDSVSRANCKDLSKPYFTQDRIYLVDTPKLTVYGLPDAKHPVWEPITAHVYPSSIHLHESPQTSSKLIGTVSGEITVGGRNYRMLYLPEAGGWVRAEYVDLSPYTLDDIPELRPDRSE